MVRAFPKPGETTKRKPGNHVRLTVTRQNRDLKKQADALVREIVYIRDGYRCVKCGTGKALTPSHIRPRWKCSRMRWMAENILTMCAACHKYWWHKDPVAASAWLIVKYPGLCERLLLWERIAPKVDMKQLLIELQAELREARRAQAI